MYLITIGEIFLKGKNRNVFQKRLLKNIKSALNIDNSKIKDLRNRIMVLSDDCSNLKYVFGINSFFKVNECSFDNINLTALSFISDEKTFRISARRLTKVYKPSQEIQEDVGEFILNNKNIKVDLHNPDINIFIEIIGDKAYLYHGSVKGLGGLPVGISPHVYIDVRDEIKSTVSGFLMMKRGCPLVLSKDISLLKKFENGFYFKIRDKKDDDTIIKDELLNEIKSSNGFTLRPLVGYSEDEVIKLYDKIKDL